MKQRDSPLGLRRYDDGMWWRRLVWSGSALLIVGLCSRAAIALPSRIYRNPDCRIHAFEPPRGWTVVPSSQVPYPRILVLAELEGEGARLVLGAERVLGGSTAIERAAKALPALAESGWNQPRIVSPEPTIVEATRDRPRRFLRQAYIVSGDLLYVLSVVAPIELRERVVRAFDSALRSVRLDPAVHADGAPATSGSGARCK